MANYFKRNERIAFAILLAINAAFAIIAIYCITVCSPYAGKFTAATGLLATLAGVVQLEVAGVFTKLFDKYGDDIKYPYGPPSYITREIIDDPDAPIKSWLKTYAFFEPGVGFWFIVCGTVIQIIALWF